MNLKDSPVLYRQFVGDFPMVVMGLGSWLYAYDHKPLLDMSSGPCASNLGHSNAFVINAIVRQLDVVPMVFSGYWASEPAEEAGALIKSWFEGKNPGWFGKVIFQGSGSEAVDLACKVAVQYHAEANENRSSLIALDHAYHGVCMMPYALTGEYPRYAMMDPYHKNLRDYQISRIPHPIDGNVDYFDDAIAWVGGAGLYKNFAALIVEPVGGPPLGCYPHSKDYLHDLRELCDKTGMLLIFDEVLCGVGRCNGLSVANYYEVWPDIVILGKGLTAGYQPMSAICLSKRVCDRIERGSGQIMFGTAFSAHTTGCAAIVATLKYMRDHELFGAVTEKGAVIHDKLASAMTPLGCKVRSLGMLHGVELPLVSSELGLHKRIRDRIMQKGVVVYSKGQTRHGQGDFLTIAPPFEITDSEIRLGIQAIKEGTTEVLEELNVLASNC